MSVRARYSAWRAAEVTHRGTFIRELIAHENLREEREFRDQEQYYQYIRDLEDERDHLPLESSY